VALSDFALIGANATFLASYLVFALGKFPGMKIDRPGMAIIGAVLMFAFGALSPPDALHFVDLGTIVLLFSMMLLVAYLHLTGFFEARCGGRRVGVGFSGGIVMLAGRVA